jgi:GGDEF domain-containing protein
MSPLCGTFELFCSEAELRVSIGVACSDAAWISAEELVQQADAAMYRSKTQGSCIPVLASCP